MLTHRALFSALLLLLVQDSESNELSQLSQLPCDSEGFLTNNVLLVPRGVELKLAQRQTIVASTALLDAAFGGADGVCLEKSTPVSLVNVSFRAYTSRPAGPTLESWSTDACQRAEIGWLSYLPRPADLFWVDVNAGQQLVPQGRLLSGERHTQWRMSYLGHKFVVQDTLPEEQGGFAPLEYVVQFDQINILGEQGDVNRKADRTPPTEKELLRQDSQEIRRAARIKRSFTPVGFKKIPVPPKLWASIQAYYRNNRAHGGVVEEWAGKGLFVNWWEADPEMIVPPWGLKQRWFELMQSTMEDWIGNVVDLERTDLYGLRRYNDGAWLVPHVDREDTHAISAIINVDQIGMRKPWKLQIDDIDGNAHQVSMEPGEAVLYESAKCRHGRPEALQGDSYVNVFFHYRPQNNPKWWTENKRYGDSVKEL